MLTGKKTPVAIPVYSGHLHINIYKLLGEIRHNLS
jgi:hypothetical protein